MTMLRLLATVTTFVGLTGAIGASLAWALVADGQARLEPAIQTLALVAALTGIVAERFAAERQRRRQALATLTGELLANRRILDELLSTLSGTHTVRRRVYPRLMVSAAEGTIASGALADDRELLARLHEWHNGVVDFNRRLDLTEMLTFLQDAPEAIRSFEEALSQHGGRAHRISQLLDEFLNVVDQIHVPKGAGRAAGRTPEPDCRRSSRPSAEPEPVSPQPVPIRREATHPATVPRYIQDKLTHTARGGGHVYQRHDLGERCHG